MSVNLPKIDKSMEDEKEITIENQEFGPNKQKFRDNFAAAYPDIDMNDEEAYFGALNDRNDQYDKDKSRLDELEDAQVKFGEALDADPRMAELFLEMTKPGGKPLEYLIENYAQAFSDLVNDPDNDEYRKALADKIAQDSADALSLQQAEEESEKNIGPTLDALAKIAEEEQLTDEQVSNAFKTAIALSEGMEKGQISEDMWRTLIKGVAYDAAVEQARTEGEAAGRNQRIREKLRSERPSSMNIQGGGGNSLGNGVQRPQRSLGRSVWDDE